MSLVRIAGTVFHSTSLLSQRFDPTGNGGEDDECNETHQNGGAASIDVALERFGRIQIPGQRPVIVTHAQEAAEQGVDRKKGNRQKSDPRVLSLTHIDD